MNLENLSLKSLKIKNPAAFEAWRDLSVLLKEIREKSGQTMTDLSRKSGISFNCISSLERCIIRPYLKYLSAYDETALSVGISPLDIFRAYEKAKDLELKYTVPESCARTHKYPPEITGPSSRESALFKTWEEYDIIERAVADPKALLMGARWLPQRAEDRMERMAFWREYVDKVDGVKKHCICSLSGY